MTQIYIIIMEFTLARKLLHLIGTSAHLTGRRPRPSNLAGSFCTTYRLIKSSSPFFLSHLEDMLRNAKFGGYIFIIPMHSLVRNSRPYFLALQQLGCPFLQREEAIKRLMAIEERMSNAIKILISQSMPMSSSMTLEF